MEHVLNIWEVCILPQLENTVIKQGKPTIPDSSKHKRSSNSVLSVFIMHLIRTSLLLS